MTEFLTETNEMPSRRERHPRGVLPFELAPEISRTPLTGTGVANWHDNPEIQLCTGGAGYILLDGVRHEMKPGDLAVVNAGVIHYTGSAGEIRYLCLIVDPGFCAEAGFDPAAFVSPSFFPAGEAEGAAAVLRELTEIWRRPDDRLRAARLRMKLLALFIELGERCASEPPRGTDDRSLGSVRRAMQYIDENQGRQMTLDEIARNSYTSVCSLSRSFRQATGQTVVQYINSLRTKRAAELIAGGMTVSEAAVRCGFSNMSYFTRTFRAYIGCLPSEAKGKR